jgi:hypothetical protein
VTFTYVLGSGRGPRDSVRMLITDTDSGSQFLQDEELDDMLSLNGSEPLLAAAMALETIASSETLVQKRITILGRSTDGPSEAVSLRAHAKQLREQYQANLGGTDAGFDWAEWTLDPASEHEIIVNGALRNG